jgi:hypothetical protein
MLNSITGSPSSGILAGLAPQQTTPSGSRASFTDQLAAALEGYLAQSGNGSNLEIDIQATQGQNSGVRQFIVTVKNPDSEPAKTSATSVTASPAASAAPASAPVTANASANTPQSAPSNTVVNKAGQSITLQMAEIDAYWAAQPPAVQQLRNVADFGARNVLAQQLSDQGYSIDRAVMVWGWDPLKTMQTRQMYGYSWVPSYNQASVSAAPNFALPGETPYDASNPPPGSIAVNADFANGLSSGDSLS